MLTVNPSTPPRLNSAKEKKKKEKMTTKEKFERSRYRKIDRDEIKPSLPQDRSVNPIQGPRRQRVTGCEGPR